MAGPGRVAGLALVTLLVACTTTPPTSPSGSASPSSSVGTSFDPGTSEPLAIAWRPLTLPVEGTVHGITGVVGGPAGGLLLVDHGIVGPGDDVARTSVLVGSANAWRVATDDSPFRWGTSIVALPTGYLAVGPRAEGTGPGTWRSSDGSDWEPLPSRLIDGVATLAADESAVIACWGRAEGPPCKVSNDGGATWVASELEGGVDSLTAHAGAFVAVVSDDQGRRVHASVDGRSWQEAPGSAAFLTGAWASDVASIGQVAVLSASTLADRHQGGQVAALAVALDGRSFEWLPLPETTSSAFRLVRTSTALVARGLSGFGQSMLTTALLVSGDGVTWRADALPPAFEGRDVTIIGAGDGLVALAVAGETTELHWGRVVRAPDPGPPVIPVPTPVPPPPDPPQPLAWELAATFDGWLWDITERDGQLVAVGRNADEAAAWTSLDGRAWTHRSVPGAERFPLMQAVAAWDGGFVAGGRDYDPAGGPMTAMFWWSEDGIAWHREPSPPGLGLGAGNDYRPPEVSGIARGPGGWVAVGSASDGPRIFLSADGRSWRLGPAIESGPEVDVHLEAIVPAADGFVVVGGSGRPFIADDATVWWTPDGENLGEPAVLDGPGLAAVATSERALVAVGDGPSAWTSTDGRMWAWVPDQSTLVAGSMSAVVVGELGIVAGGRDECPRGRDCLVAWRSIDGVSWSKVELPFADPFDRIVGIAELDGRIVIVASGERRGTNGNFGAIVWIGREP